MKILFLHPSRQDYLSDGVFHGLREELGADCVDVPRHDCMYSPLLPELRNKLRGQGFTLYGELDDLLELQAARYNWMTEISQYDLVIIANIWIQWQQYLEIRDHISHKKLILLDGVDSPECFPYASRLWKRPETYFTGVRGSLYGKRELFDQGEAWGPLRYLPRFFAKRLGIPKNVIPMAFSIPQSKITRVSSSMKTQNLNRDLVDPELTADPRLVDELSPRYPFQTEGEYYADLQKSRFGITTRRAGWDCLRHYEMAANGAVLAFRDLNHKPICCAPHGLNETNTVAYHNRDDLLAKIERITPTQYDLLLGSNYRWIEKNTTRHRALELLDYHTRYMKQG